MIEARGVSFAYPRGDRTILRDVSLLLRPAMSAELRERGVDACGERGEYHTLVTGTPLFSAPLRWRSEGRVLRSGCWALDVMVDP